MSQDVRDVPVLLLAFNRPKAFGGLIDALRLTKPANIYASFDGPRSADEARLVEMSIACLEQVDWACQLHVRRNSRNLGCRQAVRGAIKWFFLERAEGIILEDDVRPSEDFFVFAHEMLGSFRNDPQIAMINGSSRVPAASQGTERNTRLTRYSHVWGWATWRDTWEMYEQFVDDQQRGASILPLVKTLDYRLLEALYWYRKFKLARTGRIDSWALSLQEMLFVAGQLAVSPRESLVDNVGFSSGATHTHSQPRHLQKRGTWQADLQDPLPRYRDAVADRWEGRHVVPGSVGEVFARLLRRTSIQEP